MAASITISITGVSISGSTWSTGDYENITIGDKTLKELGAADSTTDTITVPGYGSFKLTDSLGSVTFTAAAGMPAGAYIFAPIATESGETGLNKETPQACITIADLSAMTGAFTLADLGTNQKNTTLTKLITGSGTDIVRGSRYTALKQISTGAGEDAVIAKAAADLKVNTGDGNDSLLLTGAATLSSAIVLGSGDDTIGVGDASATVYGGAGADVFIASNEAAAITVGDYKYSENDVIIPFYKGSISLDKEGKFSSTGVSAQLTAENGVYRAKFYQAAEVSQTLSDTTGSLANCEYWTAADSNASGIDLVNMDASGVTMAYDIDAGAASSANITLGSNGGNGGSVTLAAGASTLTTAKAGGTVAVQDFGSDDVLHLAGTFTLDGTNIESMGTTLTGVVKSNDQTILSYTENGSTTKKTVGILSGSGNVITLTTATGILDKYINNGAALAGTDGIDASALTAASSFRLNNDEGISDKYTKIYYVKSGAAGGTFVGANDGATISAEQTTSRVQSNFDLSGATTGSQLWAGGTENGMQATLNKTATQLASDTIWMGTTERETDITNFTTGFADTSDIIYLYETADVNDAELYAGVQARADVKIQGSKTAASFVKLAGTQLSTVKGAQLRLRDAAGVLHNVAVGAADEASEIEAVDTVAGAQVADYVIGNSTVAPGSKPKAVYSSSLAGQSYNVRLNNDDLATTKYQNIIDASMYVADDAKVTMVGANDTADTLGSYLVADGGQVDIWGGGGMQDTMELSTVNGAANTIWYGKTDGLDTVKNMTQALSVTAGQTDTVYFYDEASLAELVKDYTVSGANGTSIVFTHDAADVLTLTGDAQRFSIKTQAGTAKVAAAASDEAGLTYSSDTALFLGGSGIMVTASGTAGAQIRLNNDGVTGQYYLGGLRAASAAGVTGGNVILVGSAQASQGGSVLNGGYGSQNDYWGGSKAADTFTGRSGIVDVAWFDSGDGADRANGFGKEDKVYLYNTSSIDRVRVTASGDDLVIAAFDGDTLCLKDGAKAGSVIFGADGITVGLKDGSGYYVSQASDGKYGFVKKA